MELEQRKNTFLEDALQKFGTAWLGMDENSNFYKAKKKEAPDIR
jgi:hypothetical protein